MVFSHSVTGSYCERLPEPSFSSGVPALSECTVWWRIMHAPLVRDVIGEAISKVFKIWHALSHYSALRGQTLPPFLHCLPKFEVLEESVPWENSSRGILKSNTKNKTATLFFKKSNWVKITDPFFYTSLKSVWEQGTCIMCHSPGQTLAMFFEPPCTEKLVEDVKPCLPTCCIHVMRL